MIDALQVLWANSKKYMGPDRPSNPTTREALDVKTFDVSRGKNSKYNRRKIEPKDLQKMWVSLQKLSLKHPFQAECLMLMMVSGRRSTEILKTAFKIYIPVDHGISPYGQTLDRSQSRVLRTIADGVSEQVCDA